VFSLISSLLISRLFYWYILLPASSIFVLIFASIFLWSLTFSIFYLGVPKIWFFVHLFSSIRYNIMFLMTAHIFLIFLSFSRLRFSSIKSVFLFYLSNSSFNNIILFNIFNYNFLKFFNLVLWLCFISFIFSCIINFLFLEVAYLGSLIFYYHFQLIQFLFHRTIHIFFIISSEFT
jgi:hypothetical protein